MFYVMFAERQWLYLTTHPEEITVRNNLPAFSRELINIQSLVVSKQLKSRCKHIFVPEKILNSLILVPILLEEKEKLKCISLGVEFKLRQHWHQKNWTFDFASQRSFWVTGWIEVNDRDRNSWFGICWWICIKYFQAWLFLGQCFKLQCISFVKLCKINGDFLG